MGNDPGKSVADEFNEAHDTKNVFVMDASCFPTSSGVNPMISVASIAHRGTTLLAERLAGSGTFSAGVHVWLNELSGLLCIVLSPPRGGGGLQRKGCKDGGVGSYPNQTSSV